MLKETLSALQFQTRGIFALVWRNQVRCLGEIKIGSLRRGEIFGEEKTREHFHVRRSSVSHPRAVSTLDTK